MSERENLVLYHERLTSLTEVAIVRTEEDLASSRIRSGSANNGLAICLVIGFQEGLPLLSFQFSGTTYAHLAIAVVGGMDGIEVGDQVCAAFDQNRCDRPIVLGRLSCDTSKNLTANAGTLIVDDNQITLKCGKASINLKADGTVAIRGTNVASRASNTNRIRGGNVQIN